MMNSRKRIVVLVGLAVAGWAFHQFGRGIWEPIVLRMTGQRTVGQVVGDTGPAAEERLRPHFQQAGVMYPPAAVALLGFKKEKRLELWARDHASGPWRRVRDYPILGASGTMGPKLLQGDRQVPEGLYHVEALNPNSAFYLSMRLNYPNPFDVARAEEEGRTDPGSDIYIHGKEASIGCLAMGDEAIEELFVLTAVVGEDHVEVILAPRDFRDGALPSTDGLPPWTGSLYNEIGEALAAFPREAQTTNGT